MKPNNQEVRFTQKQLEYLEGLFPQMVHSPQTPEATIRDYFGTQRVMQEIRKRVQRDNFAPVHQVPAGSMRQ